VYIIVAGGGKIGYYLARELIAQEHEVLIIEKDGRRVDLINSDLGNVVFLGDAAEASTLMEVGAGRADLVCAVTGDDEDNLVIAQLAKRHFNVGRTIARINNPKNEEIFRYLGIDATVSTTDIILSILEQEIPSEAVVPLLRFRHADVEIVEAMVPRDAPVIGRALRELHLPQESTIAIVIRAGAAIFPDGDTRLQAGDEVVAFTRSTHEAELRELFFSKAAPR
jgi:trk system potassium uptake protein TrkA